MFGDGGIKRPVPSMWARVKFWLAKEINKYLHAGEVQLRRQESYEIANCPGAILRRAGSQKSWREKWELAVDGETSVAVAMVGNPCLLDESKTRFLHLPVIRVSGQHLVLVFKAQQTCGGTGGYGGYYDMDFFGRVLLAVDVATVRKIRSKINRWEFFLRKLEWQSWSYIKRYKYKHFGT